MKLCLFCDLPCEGCFCSAICWRQYKADMAAGRRVRMNDFPIAGIHFHCQECGNRFVAQDKKQYFCSPECYEIHYPKSTTLKLLDRARVVVATLSKRG